MFHFRKDFLSAKGQVNREHIHNKINMQSVKHFNSIIIHKKRVSQPWDRCVPLMSRCVQHPISQSAELLMVNWHHQRCTAWCFHPNSVRARFDLKARWGACVLAALDLHFLYLISKFRNTCKGKKTWGDLSQRSYSKSTIELSSVREIKLEVFSWDLRILATGFLTAVH